MPVRTVVTRVSCTVAVLARLAWPAIALPGQQPAAEGTPPIPTFDKTETMVAMRDGVKLHTNIFVPRGFAGNLPIIMIRTPYGIEGGEASFQRTVRRAGARRLHLRLPGHPRRFESEGQFVMLRPAARQEAIRRRSTRAPTRTTRSTGCSRTCRTTTGASGCWASRIPGWLTVMAHARSASRAQGRLAAGVAGRHVPRRRLPPQRRVPAQLRLRVRRDDGDRQGARRPSQFDGSDTYDWYLALGSLANVNEKYLHGKIPTWNDFVDHPNYDAFWQKQAVVTVPRSSVTVPTLNVAGWWDQEDFYGPIKIYELLEKHDTKHLNFLVVGPWNHGGWSGQTGGKLGRRLRQRRRRWNIREHVQAPWFAYWLKDKGTLDLARSHDVRGAERTRGRAIDSWPPKTGRDASSRLYFAGGSASSRSIRRPSDGRTPFDAYVSDPANPVPYRQRPILPTYGARRRRGRAGWSTISGSSTTGRTC